MREERSAPKENSPKLFQKNFGFSVFVLIAVYGFSVFSIWLSVFAQNTDGFSDLVCDVVSGFPIWVPVSLRFEQPPPISNGRETSVCSTCYH